IEHETEAGRIGVSPSVVEGVSKEKEIACRKIGAVVLRGKAKEMDLYEVLWREQDLAVKLRPEKVSGEQLAVATGTRLGLEEDVRKAIEAAVRGKAKEPKALAIEKRTFALVQVLPDQTLGKRFPLTGDTTVVGREQGDIRFENDSLMSRQHALFTTLSGALYVEDLDSANGVFVRIRIPHTLKPEDVILLGRQMFRFRMLSHDQAREATRKSGEKSATPAPAEEKTEGKKGKKSSSTSGAAEAGESSEPLAELVRLLKEGEEEEHFTLCRGATTIGRLKANYTFPDDRYLSRSHARFNVHGPRSTVEDLNSLNGTFVRIRERHLLDAEDTVLVGGQLLRVIAESK
ncbi:MAG: FHA domain-containing protein, partial [Terriglobia bacterium]